MSLPVQIPFPLNVPVAALGAVLCIDLEALRQNYRILQVRSKDAALSGVLKADSYGLGAAQIAPVLIEEGCRHFFFAHAAEAAALRPLLTDRACYVLNGLLTGEPEEFVEAGIHPVLNSLHDLRVWQDLARKMERVLPAVLHFDTGMNRLGLGTYETEILLRERETRLQGLDVCLIMSHFSCADEEAHSETPRQIKRFEFIKDFFPNTPASLCNSAGIFAAPDALYQITRSGMALYGLNPTPSRQNPMHPVVSLHTPILTIQTVPRGEPIGYGASYTVQTAPGQEHERVATVNLGYADGFFRSLSGGGKLFWNGIACPIRGRVSMDLVTVSLAQVPEDQIPHPGAYLEVIGPSQTPADLAKDSVGLQSDYEVLTSLGPRLKRVYI
ncbi:MAG: alanine racemase [Rhodospirillales bacterium]|nr:alanine racemase [Rhodospirillales bacterium]MCB9964756.1 alanine racemase [Rhodospirillales bacterium]MCB9980664.1 alanine racemase [Rhodospirillales bacterium]